MYGNVPIYRNQIEMKDKDDAIKRSARAYKDVLPNSIVRLFLVYDYKKSRVSYKKRTVFLSTTKKGKKKNHFFEKYLNLGYYVFVENKKSAQHDHMFSVYELTENGENLFIILDL